MACVSSLIVISSWSATRAHQETTVVAATVASRHLLDSKRLVKSAFIDGVASCGIL